MDGLILLISSGLASGASYAVVALALVMIFQATHHINFAQGEMAMFSTFLALAAIEAGLPYWAAFFFTMIVSFVVAAIIQMAIIRPLRDAPVLSVVTVFIGLFVIFHALAGWIFGYQIRVFPSPFPEQMALGHWMSAHEIGTILVTLLLVALLFCFFRLTSIGLAMRGAADNPASARLLGHNVGFLLILGWGLAGAIGSVAGMMVAPIVFLDPTMMSGVLLYAFAGALIGGIDSPLGAVAGGFIVGVVENLVGAYLVGSELKFAFALVMIVGVLVIRPSGLMGRTIVTRV